MPAKNEITYKPMLARIASVVNENETIRTFRFSFLRKQDAASFSVDPGQFAQFSVPGIGEAPFSMCSASSKKNSFEVSVRQVGNVTKAMFGLKPGDRIWVRGPYGHGFPVKSILDMDVMLVGGGIGFPPLASVVEHIIQNRERYGKVWVLYGSRDIDELIYEERMKRWSKAPDLEVLVTVETPCAKWNGCVGVVTKLFDKLRIEGIRTAGLSCGPPVMLKFVTQGMQKLGIKDENIHLSLERMMQCGIGKCGHCNIGDKYVCRDGPVFCYDDIKAMLERAW